VRDFGENYLQEFEGKYEQVSNLDGARFHLIGHLQSNQAGVRRSCSTRFKPSQREAGASS